MSLRLVAASFAGKRPGHWHYRSAPARTQRKRVELLNYCRRRAEPSTSGLAGGLSAATPRRPFHVKRPRRASSEAAGPFHVKRRCRALRKPPARFTRNAGYIRVRYRGLPSAEGSVPRSRLPGVLGASAAAQAFGNTGAASDHDGPSDTARPSRKAPARTPDGDG